MRLKINEIFNNLNATEKSIDEVINNFEIEEKV